MTPSSPPRSVLIIKPSSLGDVTHAFPVVALVKKHFPDTAIDWLIGESFAPLLEYLGPMVRRAVPFPRQAFKGLGLFTQSLRLFAELRREPYDLALDLQGLARSALFAAVSRAARRAGFARPRESFARLFYQQTVDPPETAVHAIEKNLFLTAGVLGVPVEIIRPELPVIPHYRQAARAALSERGIDPDAPYLSVAPGARWESKRWPPAFFDQVRSRLAENDAAIPWVIVGSPDEAEAARELMARPSVAKTVSLVGATSLPTLLEVLRGGAALLTHDSGPMHIAAALGVPLVALFGPTDPARTGPYWKGCRTFQASEGCIRCLRRYCSRQSPECQTNVNPQQVGDALREALEPAR